MVLLMTKTQNATAPFNDSRDEIAAQPQLAELRKLSGNDIFNLLHILASATDRFTEVHGDDEAGTFWDLEFLRMDVSELTTERYS